MKKYILLNLGLFACDRSQEDTSALIDTTCRPCDESFYLNGSLSEEERYTNEYFDRPPFHTLEDIQYCSSISRHLELSFIDIEEADFSCLQEVGSLTVSYSPSTTFENLSHISSIGALWIINNKHLTDLNLFPNITNLSSPGLTISSNSSLTKIAGFGKLQSTQDIEISSNHNLSEILAFEALEVIEGSVEIRNNSLLETIPEFPNITSIYPDGDSSSSRLTIKENPSLINTGFTNLESINGELEINENASLSNIGLPNLQEIEILSIEDNSSLTNLGLENLVQCKVRALINANHSLCQMYAIDFLENIEVGSVTLGTNNGDCSEWEGSQ